MSYGCLRNNNYSKINVYYCTFYLNSPHSLKYSRIYARSKTEALAIARNRYKETKDVANVYLENDIAHLKVLGMQLLEEIPHEIYGKGESMKKNKKDFKLVC